MTTQTKYTPKELMAQGRADGMQSAKRLIEIQRLEQINSELLEACKEGLKAAEALHWHTAEKYPTLKKRYNKIRQAIAKVEATR